MHYAYHNLCGFYIVIQNLYSPISLYVHMYVGIVIICMYIHNVCTYVFTYIMYCMCNVQGIDVKSMGRIFIGLVKCGAWGCFDEFNRLEEAVLSAVSMQIQTIQASIKSRETTTELLDKQVCKSLYHCYMYVCMYCMYVVVQYSQHL